MRTFIFLKNYREGKKIYKTIVGMTQSKTFPSSLLNCKGSCFYGCECKEIEERCYVRIATENI